jgi:hypothetical protein
VHVIMLLVYGEPCYSSCQVIQRASMWIQEKTQKAQNARMSRGTGGMLCGHYEASVANAILRSCLTRRKTLFKVESGVAQRDGSSVGERGTDNDELAHLGDGFAELSEVTAAEVDGDGRDRSRGRRGGRSRNSG